MEFFSSKGHFNGLFRFLQVREKLNEEVELYSSSNYKTEDEVMDPWDIFSFDDNQTRWASKFIANSWIQINLKRSYLQLKKYSIQSISAPYFFRSWRLDASKDNFTTNVA